MQVIPIAIIGLYLLLNSCGTDVRAGKGDDAGLVGQTNAIVQVPVDHYVKKTKDTKFNRICFGFGKKLDKFFTKIGL